MPKCHITVTVYPLPWNQWLTLCYTQGPLTHALELSSISHGPLMLSSQATVDIQNIYYSANEENLTYRMRQPKVPEQARTLSKVVILGLYAAFFSHVSSQDLWMVMSTTWPTWLGLHTRAPQQQEHFSKIIWWLAMKFHADIHGSQRLYPADVGELWHFPLVSPCG